MGRTRRASYMKSILFVDDEPLILDGLRRMLYSNRHRWEIHFAPSGEEALRLCTQKSFDIVISDLRMPGMDGATFLRNVRDCLPNASRIVLTGYSESALAIRSITVAHRASVLIRWGFCIEWTSFARFALTRSSRPEQSCFC